MKVCADCRKPMTRLNYSQILVWGKTKCKSGVLYECPRCMAKMVVVSSQEWNDKYILQKDDSAIDMDDSERLAH